MNLLKEILKKLSDGEPLPPKNRDHNLSGNYSNCRECYITPDWLLIYEVYEEELYLYLTRTGNHSDLFQDGRIFSLEEYPYTGKRHY